MARTRKTADQLIDEASSLPANSRKAAQLLMSAATELAKPARKPRKAAVRMDAARKADANKVTGTVIEEKSGTVTIVNLRAEGLSSTEEVTSALQKAMTPREFKKAFGISPETAAWFIQMVEDAPNWGGQPLVGGNVPFTSSDWGRLSHLKTSGFVTTVKTRDKINNRTGNYAWLNFTVAGVELAANLLPGFNTSILTKAV